MRILVAIGGLVLLPVAGAVGVMATANARAAEQALTEQQDAFVRFTVGTVELGLSAGRVGAVQEFLGDLAENPLFGGAILYGEDLRPLLRLPANYQVSDARRDSVLRLGSVSADDRVYQAAELRDIDGSVLGHLLLAVSLEPLAQRAYQAWRVTVFAGAALLIPIYVVIGWLLTWMERTLRARERRIREAEQEIAVLAERRQAHQERARLEAQLRQAQKMETIGTLAGGIAHDFNNILTPILGYTDMLLADATPGTETHEDLSHVQQCANRAKELVGQILAFGRRQETVVAPCGLPELIEEVVDLIRATVPASIDISTRIDATCPAVIADATQLHQVLMNLCTNAVQAMGATHGYLTVTLDTVEVDERLARLNPTAEPGAYARISVRDTGAGMDAETAARIFEPFYTTKDVGQGTGLGLSVSHGIVTAHHGFVTVDSEVGVGTLMAVHLPLPAIDESRPDEQHETEEETPARARILVADDEEVVTSLVVRMLTRLEYAVEAYPGASEAHARFLENPDAWDLVLTDQAMPGCTGLDWATELRAVRPDLPILVMTGYSERVANGEWRDVGVHAVLMKPLSIPELGLAVEEALAAYRDTA